MSGATHTPGPWRFIESSQTIVSNQSHPIARLTEPFHRKCFDGQTGVDGPLIAAAPELRALLAKMIKKIRDDSGSADPMEPFAYDASWEALAIEVDATLAKATPT